MTPRKPKVKPMRAYADERLVDLVPTPTSGVPSPGPFDGGETRSSWPRAGKRALGLSVPWGSPAPEPEPEPTDWTAETVRVRFAEAMQILDRLPLGPTDRPSTKTGGTLPVVHSIASAYGYAQAESRVRPTAAEIDRMDDVLTWLWWIPAEWRKAVIGVARNVPLRRIAKVMRCSHTHVARLERKAVERIARRLMKRERARDLVDK